MIKTIEEAIEALGFTELPDEKLFKSSWRKIAREAHPDIGGDHEKFCDINESIAILKNYYRNLKQKENLIRASKKVNVIMNIADIERMFSGEKLTVESNGKKYDIGMESIDGIVNILLFEDISIKIRYVESGISYEVTVKDIIKFNKFGVNKFKAYVPDKYIGSEMEIQVKVQNKKMKVTTRAETVSFSFKVSHLVFVVEVWREPLNDS